jgi:hypothetical protein
LYITVSNYSAFVGIYTVTSLTARKMDNFKFQKDAINSAWQKVAAEMRDTGL